MKPMDITEKKYELKSGVTRQDLKRAGFHYGLYMVPLYKREAVLMVVADISDETDPFVSISVYDPIYRHVYAPFYDRKYGGKNLIRDEIDRRYIEELDKLVEKGILVCTTDKKKNRRNKNASDKNSKV